MGTKRALGHVVRTAIQQSSRRGRVADLFSGMSAIAHELSSRRSVFLNDVMAFPTIFARANCLENTRRTPATLLPEIYPLFKQHRNTLRRDFADRIEEERSALTAGGEVLSNWMALAPHVGNSPTYKRMATYSRTASTYKRFRLTTLYFASGYFSTEQAIDFDSLRFALENTRMSQRTAAPIFAVWLATASRVINSPGHSAQFLKASSNRACRRIQSQMSKDVWAAFTELAHDFSPWGSTRWRRGNTVVQGDALKIISTSIPDDVSVVYADPPYTKDQYSRFYHLFETLLLYDYPSSSGVGRYREERYASPFCHVTGVVSAFERLFEGVHHLGVPLVLSYPSDGMLNRVGIPIRSFVRDHFDNVKVRSVPSSHSTMGGSNGVARKETVEHIFVCK